MIANVAENLKLAEVLRLKEELELMNVRVQVAQDKLNIVLERQKILKDKYLEACIELSVIREPLSLWRWRGIRFFKK